MLKAFLDEVKSFAVSRSLMSALELDLFKALEPGALSRAELRERLGLAEGPITEAFFDVLVACEALQEEGGRLSLAPLAQAVLPVHDAVQSWSREMALFYASLTDLPSLLKSGRFQESALSGFWGYKKTDDPRELNRSDVAAYSDVMAASQRQLSEVLLSEHDFGRHRHVLDVGGGYGALASALAVRFPDMRVTVADLPAVCEGARERMEKEGALQDRIHFLPVDFFRDRLPKGVADAVVFCRVLHDWSDAQASALVARVGACIEPGGTLYVVEPMQEEENRTERGNALSAFMLTLLGGHRRSAGAYREMLEAAGYDQVTSRPLGLSIYKLVSGRNGAHPR